MTQSAEETRTLPEVTDWHAPGVWVALDPKGTTLADTFGDTPYSARASLVRDHNLLWSKAVAQGYSICKLGPIAVMAVEEHLRKAP